MAKPGWKEKMKKKSREWSEKNTFTLKEGENVFRILPNPEGVYVDKEADADDDPKNMPMAFYWAHPNVGRGNNKTFVTCGKSGDNAADLEGECWLCDEKIPELAKSKKEALRDKAEEIATIQQVVFQVATIDDGKWRGPKTWYLTVRKKALANRLISFLSSPKPYDDPVKGYNMLIERTGTGMKTDYGSVQAEDESSKVPSGIIAKLKPFSEIVREYSEEHQKAVYYGREEEEEAEDEEALEPEEEETEENGEEEEETPKAEKKKKPANEDEGEEDESEDAEEESEEESEDEEEKPKAKKKKPAEEEEEEESEEDEDADTPPDDEEEEEEKPKGKKKKPAKDEDEEEESSDDEEEEEKPKGKKKPSKDEDEEESEDEDSESDSESADEDEEEEEEKPKAKKAKKGKR